MRHERVRCALAPRDLTRRASRNPRAANTKRVPSLAHVRRIGPLAALPAQDAVLRSKLKVTFPEIQHFLQGLQVTVRPSVIPGSADSSGSLGSLEGWGPVGFERPRLLTTSLCKPRCIGLAV